jgi:allophanate hydrolase
VVIGNSPGATCVEVSAGGVVLEVVSGTVTIAVAGGEFDVEVSGSMMPSWNAVSIREGDRVTVRPGPRGSWTYVAVAGELDVPHWLDSSATHSMSGFGGGALVAGSEFDVSGARVAHDRVGEIPAPAFRRAVAPVRVVIGPQQRHFQPAAIEAFTASAYTVTDASDRMGVRLAGPPLDLAGALSIPSEPIVRGSVQVTGDGVPTVLLADHQTTGGYPKIATVISPDLDGFTQLRAGDRVDFEAITAGEAVREARADSGLVEEYLSLVAGPGRTLEHRLRQQNLIGGAILPDR